MYHCTETLLSPWDYVSLVQNMQLYFSYWVQHIDSIKTCQYPTVNSQILIFFHDRAVDLCNLYNEMSLFLTNAVLIYRGLGPMTHRTVDISDQWYFGLLIIRTNDPSDHWPLQDTPEYRPFGLMTLRTIDHSDQWSVGLLTIRTNDPLDFWPFGPMPIRTITLRITGRSD